MYPKPMIVFDFTSLGKKPDVDLNRALYEYNASILTLEDKRARLLSIARKLADNNAKAKKILARITDTIAL